MTLSLTSPAPDTVDAERGWAVVEICPDGTLGTAQLVRAVEARDAVQVARRAHPLPRSLVASGALDARLGLALAAAGRAVDAQLAFTSVLSRSPGTASHQECAGHLALVEACRGELHKASHRAEQVLAMADGGAGAASAHLALAWVSGERDHHDAAQHLALAASAARPDAWTRTVRTLLEARLLLPTRPDSAVRLLASAVDPRGTASATRAGWSAAALTVARADALLVLGEPRRALAALTPAPPEMAVEAGVTIAGARLDIGDVRGAAAVLSSQEDQLETAGLATQLHAWLLEARAAESGGRAPRAAVLVDRVLHCASAEELIAPVRRHWAWLRVHVERDPASARTHRHLLESIRDVQVGPGESPGGRLRSPGTDELPGVRLTRREAEVLDLLARMYSTDEVAAELYVSANTVKTHLKGIYAKLCVNRRADAVRRGRQLGLC